MIQILQAKLGSVRKSLNDAYQQCDQHGVTHYSAQEELLENLLDQCAHIEYGYDTQEYYGDDEFYSDPLEDYYSDLAMYKHEEISDMYNKHYHFSWWISKNVLHTDSMWFTSDEIEAFRVIWQRRISAM